VSAVGRCCSTDASFTDTIVNEQAVTGMSQRHLHLRTIRIALRPVDASHLMVSHAKS
jgi:hypothetical protein